MLEAGLQQITLLLLESSSPSEDTNLSQIETKSGMVLGTVAYMSPEQTRGKAVDARSDIWSFGVVIYEMLAKRTPFAGETANDTIAAILKSEPLPLDEETPSELRRIVLKSLQKQTDKRYQTVKDLLLDIKNLKRKFEFSEEFERSYTSHPTNLSNVGTAGMRENATSTLFGLNSGQKSLPPAVSSAEYLASRFKQSRFRTVLTVALTVFLIAGAGFSVYEFTGNRKSDIAFESAKFARLTNTGKAVTTTPGKSTSRAIISGSPFC